MLTLSFVPALSLTKTVDAENTAFFTSTTFQHIRYDGATYDYIGTGDPIRLSGDSRKLRDENVLNGKSLAIFAIESSIWNKDVSGACRTMSDDSPKKYLTIDSALYSAMKGGKGDAIRASQYAMWRGLTTSCQWTPGDKVLTTVLINPPFWGGEFKAAWNLPNGLSTIPSLASINETAPEKQAFNYSKTLSVLGASTYLNTNGTLAIKTIWIGQLGAPQTGELYAVSGSKIGSKIRDVSLTAAGITKGQTVTGTVYWGDGANKAAVKGYTGAKAIMVELVDSKTGKKVAEKAVDRATGTYNFGYVDAGSYELTINCQLDSEIKQFFESLGGLKAADATEVTGKTSIEVTEKELKGSTDIILSSEVVTNPGALDDLFASAMANSIKWAIGALNWAIRGMMLMVVEAIEAGDEINQLESLKAVWTDIKNFSLSLLTIGIVIIAFANILQIDIQRWGIAKLIPKLVIALVMSYFSYLIIQFLLEFATAATKGIIASAGGGKNTIENLANKWPDIFPQTAIDGITKQGAAQGLFIVLLLLGLLLTCLWLVLVLFVRKAMIMFLVAVAPLAFMMQVLPFTEKMYSQWWEKFWKWVFMGPSIAFILYLGTEFLVIGYSYQKLAPGSDFTGYGAASDALLQPDAWIFLILTAICWGMAAFLPLTTGKDVFGQIQNGFKKYGHFVPGVKQMRTWNKNKGAYTDQRVKQQVQTAQKRVVQGVGPAGSKRQKVTAAIGRGLVGVDKSQAVNMPNKDIKREAFEKGDKALVNRYIKEHPGDIDAMIGAAKGGKLESDLAPLLEQLIATNREGTDELKNTISKEMPDYWAGAVNDSHGNQETVNKALESISKRKLEDLKGADLQFIHGQRGQQSGQRIIHEVVNNDGALKKILGQSQEVQAKWGQVLQDSGHVRGANTEIDRLLDARDHYSATRPAGTAF